MTRSLHHARATVILDHLVCHHYSNAKLISEALEGAQKET